MNPFDQCSVKVKSYPRNSLAAASAEQPLLLSAESLKSLRRLRPRLACHLRCSPSLSLSSAAASGRKLRRLQRKQEDKMSHLNDRSPAGGRPSPPVSQTGRPR